MSKIQFHGWYPSWGRYNGRYIPDDVPFDTVDSLSFHSLTPDEDGTIVTNESVDEANLEDFRELKAPGGPAENVPIELNLGGWNSSTHFSDAALTSENRERFAETAVEWMREYNLDGMNFDWEYPDGGGAAGNVERDEDIDTVVLLLERLRAELDDAEVEDGQTYPLTYYGPYQTDKIDAMRIRDMYEHLDYWGVMTFEMAGGWSSVTTHDSPVTGSPSMAEAMDKMESEGVDLDSLIVEWGVFGKEWSGVPPGDEGDGLGQTPGSYEGTHRYDEIVEMLNEDSGWVEHWDDETDSSYLYHPDDERFITYTSPEAAEVRTEFVEDRGYHMATVWEHSMDPDNDFHATIRDAIDSKDVQSGFTVITQDETTGEAIESVDVTLTSGRQDN